MRRAFQWVLVVPAILGLLLAGCSGSDDDASAKGDRTAATGVTTQGTATPRPVSAGREGDPATVSAKEVCAALKGVRAAVKDADNNRDARAAISVRLTQVYSAKQLAGQMKPATVDALTRETCPKTRTQLLRSAGLKSLADI